MATKVISFDDLLECKVNILFQLQKALSDSCVKQDEESIKNARALKAQLDLVMKLLEDIKGE